MKDEHIYHCLEPGWALADDRAVVFLPFRWYDGKHSFMKTMNSWFHHLKTLLEDK